MGRKRCADKRMEQIYKVIKEQLMKKGYPPSVREIGKEVGLKSSSTVHGYLNQLEAAGMIRRDPTKPRAIDLLEDKPWERTVNVPLVGTVTVIDAIVVLSVLNSNGMPAGNAWLLMPATADGASAAAGRWS